MKSRRRKRRKLTQVDVGLAAERGPDDGVLAGLERVRVDLAFQDVVAQERGQRGRAGVTAEGRDGAVVGREDGVVALLEFTQELGRLGGGQSAGEAGQTGTREGGEGAGGIRRVAAVTAAASCGSGRGRCAGGTGRARRDGRAGGARRAAGRGRGRAGLGGDRGAERAGVLARDGRRGGREGRRERVVGRLGRRGGQTRGCDEEKCRVSYETRPRGVM